jgi:hypothetical protein
MRAGITFSLAIAAIAAIAAVAFATLIPARTCDVPVGMGRRL